MDVLTLPMPPIDVVAARRAAAQAGRWLVILGFRLRPQAQPISRWTSCYADLLGGEASDADRLATCRRYLEAVRLQIERERWSWEADHHPATVEQDERAWRTTERGMALKAIEQLLHEAVIGLDSAVSKFR